MKNFTSVFVMLLLLGGTTLAQENEGVVTETVVKKTVVRTGDKVETKVVEETVKENAYRIGLSFFYNQKL